MNGEVLMIARLVPPADFSGAGLAALRLARRLADEGVSVRVLCTLDGAWRPRREIVEGVEVIRWPSRRRRERIDKAALVLATAAHLLRHPRRYAIVHLHGAYYVLRLLRLLKPLVGFRLVYKATMLGQDDAETINRRRGAALVAAVDAWVSIGDALADATRRAGIGNGRVWRLPNGTDLRRFRPLAPQRRRAVRAALGLGDERAWISVGALIRRKRPALMIEAWARLADRDDVLLLVGPRDVEPDYVEELRAAVRRHGLERRVRMLGERADVPELLGALDGFVFASEREGMPNAVLEALAAGLPVVSVRLAAGDELEAAAGGRLRQVEPAPAALATAIATVDQQPGTVPEGIRRYDLERVAQEYRALYGAIT